MLHVVGCFIAAAFSALIVMSKSVLLRKFDLADDVKNARCSSQRIFLGRLYTNDGWSQAGSQTMLVFIVFP